MAFPYALGGLVLAAALVAVYAFRNRFRHRPVSSLMLWRQTQLPKEGGVKRDRPRLPWLFYLEMAVICALIAAATAPHRRTVWHNSLIVIFDASASMAAVDSQGASPQIRAAAALRKVARSSRYGRIKLVVARRHGGETLATIAPNRVANQLADIECNEAGVKLEAVLAQVNEMADEIDDILVITDHAPSIPDGWRPGLRWLALGTPLANTAITLAERNQNLEGAEELLIEVCRFGGSASATALKISPLHGGDPLFHKQLTFNEEGHARLRLTLPTDTAPLAVELPDDALAIDNRAILWPDNPTPLKVEISLKDSGLRRMVERALKATGRVQIVTAAGELSFTAPPIVQRRADDPWYCLLTPPADGRLMRLPWLSDSNHHLMEGVNFERLAMVVGTNNLPGHGLLYAGQQPLITFETNPRLPPILHLQTTSAHEDLYRSTAWPALVHNLVTACMASRPGPAHPNLRSGQPTTFATERGVTKVTFETPHGVEQHHVQSGQLEWAPTQPGLYAMLAGDKSRIPFAVNFCAPGESDLRMALNGNWQGARQNEQLQLTHRPMAWLLGTIAILLLGLHHFLIGRTYRTAGVAAHSNASATELSSEAKEDKPV